MIDVNEVDRQLRRIGVNFQFWNKPEVRELPKILFDNEEIRHAVSGRYNGGFALMVATNLRVLLIDKKPFYLTLEDIRYDMISDVQFSHRLLDATMRLGTVNNAIAFLAYNHGRLRDMTNYIQQQVMYYRQRQLSDNGQGAQSQRVVESARFAPVLESLIQSEPVNPYNAPVMIRRRVSKFY